jgi:hypothetical protein
MTLVVAIVFGGGLALLGVLIPLTARIARWRPGFNYRGGTEEQRAQLAKGRWYWKNILGVGPAYR